MKKLIAIMVLGLLLSGNAYAEYNHKDYLINKKNKENVTHNLLADKWNNFLEQMESDDSCNRIPATETLYTDMMDCYYRNIKKYMNRNDIVASERIVDAFHDYYEDAFYRAKAMQIKLYRGAIRGNFDVEGDILNWVNFANASYEDTVKYSRKVWIDFTEKMSMANKPKNTIQSGSGFFINNKGYFITNNHVINGCRQSKITFKEVSMNAEIIAKDQTLDLALLKANVRPENYLNLSDDPPEKLQRIYVAGYPFGKGLSDDLKLTQGIISSVKGYGDNSNQIQIDAAINSGNSGGPIVDEDGDLVGVAVSGMKKSKAEGIAFGIKSAAVKNFLDVNKIKYSTSSLMNFGMNNKKLNNLLEDSTVYTFCN
ncbi:serine protease [Pelagibacteraceae bacterium]|nr:serine protease [Pelagibacteraceae bacterium]